MKGVLKTDVFSRFFKNVRFLLAEQIRLLRGSLSLDPLLRPNRLKLGKAKGSRRGVEDECDSAAIGPQGINEGQSTVSVLTQLGVAPALFAD
jgi:hypothetical protein